MKSMTYQHCCVSSMRVSFNVNSNRFNSHNNRAMGVDVRGSHFWELSSCANSLAGNLPGKGKKVPLEYCRSRHDKDVDSSVVEEPIELDNAVSDDAAFLLKLVGVSFAGWLMTKSNALMKRMPRLAASRWKH